MQHGQFDQYLDDSEKVSGKVNGTVKWLPKAGE
jgi:hypothetical protein